MADITLPIDENCFLGQSGQIIANVSNNGPSHCDRPMFSFYNGDPTLDVMIGSASITLMAGVEGQVSVTWTPDVSGICNLVALLENITRDRHQSIE